MASPIKRCVNGHNICGGCKERHSECPSCRGKFIEARNIVLEKRAATVVYPCKNKETGCTETFALEERDNHLAECLFQSRECPFRKLSGVDCTWKGTLSVIFVHLVVKHVSEIVQIPEHFKVHLLDFAGGRSYRIAVYIQDELFYLAWETEGDIFSFGVFHFGPKNETKTFKYGIKIGDSAEYFAITRKCHSYLEGGLRDMQPGKCVTIHYGTIQECLGENGNLSCEIEIGKWKLEGFVVDEMKEYLEVCYAICSSETNSGSRAIVEQQHHQQEQLRNLRILLLEQLEQEQQEQGQEQQQWNLQLLLDQLEQEQEGQQEQQEQNPLLSQQLRQWQQQLRQQQQQQQPGRLHRLLQLLRLRKQKERC
jgi:hypothetical protein